MSNVPPKTRTLDDLVPGASEAGAVPALHLLLQGDRPLEPSMHLNLGAVDRVRIGRGAARAAVLGTEEDPRLLVLRVCDAWMSTNHAYLVRDDEGGFRIEDAGSRNGTRVNCERIGVARPLDDGDVVEVGRTFFLYRRSKSFVGREGPTPESATCVAEHARDLDNAARVAKTKVPIVIVGETGTGKEVMARALHDLSGRRGEFVAINCGAVPETLFEAELFGHRRGAFSGATDDRPGLVRASDGGTLFLDEISELRPACQTALLRVLQEEEVLPIGATRPVSVDLRVLAATQQDITDLVASDRFREDLLGRLTGFTLRLPPLRERREDLGALVASLLRRVTSAPTATLHADAVRALVQYDWPRNVRELERALATAVALARDGPIELTHLPTDVRQPRRPSLVDGEAIEDGDAAEDAALRSRLVALLREHRGNVTRVARAMATRRMQIHRWAKRFGVDLAAFRR